MVVETTTTTIHGLAASIRAVTESDTFDLGGLPATTIETAVAQAFRDPFPQLLKANDMIRITLVVGAGKQARQKYDANALKLVTSTLQKVGFSEDRGASGIRECAGLYKFQHDTGKNLKTVVVFPKLPVSNGISNTNGKTENQDPASSSSILPPNSIEYKVAACSLSVFVNMVQSRCPTWSQKKALLQLLEEKIGSEMKECDRLLLQGQPLSESQQCFYDDCTTQLDEKRQHLQQALHTQVDEGQLTQPELTHLLEQVQHRIEECQKQGKSADKALQRQTKLRGITAVPLPKMKHSAELGRLWKQLKSLEHLDENSSALLSVQDTKRLGQKLDLLEQIEELEQASRGWLEDDETFEARREACQHEYRVKYGLGKSGSKSGKAGTSARAGGGAVTSKTRVRVPITKWVTPGEQKAKAMSKSKSRMKKGDVFGAMMAADEASSSDEDETSLPENNVVSAPAPASTNAPTTATSTKDITKEQPRTSSKKNKKKNKKKCKNVDYIAEIGNEMAPRSQDATRSTSNESTSTSTLARGALSLVVSLLQLLWSLIVWLVGLVFVSGKKKKKSPKEKVQ